MKLSDSTLDKVLVQILSPIFSTEVSLDDPRWGLRVKRVWTESLVGDTDEEVSFYPYYCVMEGPTRSSKALYYMSLVTDRVSLQT